MRGTAQKMNGVGSRKNWGRMTKKMNGTQVEEIRERKFFGG